MKISLFASVRGAPERAAAVSLHLVRGPTRLQANEHGPPGNYQFINLSIYQFINPVVVVVVVIDNVIVVEPGGVPDRFPLSLLLP